MMNNGFFAQNERGNLKTDSNLGKLLFCSIAVVSSE